MAALEAAAAHEVPAASAREDPEPEALDAAPPAAPEYNDAHVAPEAHVDPGAPATPEAPEAPADHDTSAAHVSPGNHDARDALQPVPDHVAREPHVAPAIPEDLHGAPAAVPVAPGADGTVTAQQTVQVRLCCFRIHLKIATKCVRISILMSGPHLNRGSTRT